MKRVSLSLVFLAWSICCLGQTTPNPAPRPLFADQTKFVLLEGKMGRSFLKKEEHFSEAARVFFGGAGVSVGLEKGRTLIGIGGSFEFFDLLDDSYAFPLYLTLRHCIGDDTRNGMFVAVKAGYILGGKTTFSSTTMVWGHELMGTTLRSMQGPYGEVLLGYSYQGFDFFVSYNYRVVNYESHYMWAPPLPNPDTAWKKSMHTVMGGVGFRLF